MADGPRFGAGRQELSFGRGGGCRWRCWSWQACLPPVSSSRSSRRPMISAPQDGLSTKKPIDVRAAKVGLAHPQPTLPRYRLHRVLAVDAAHAEVFDFEELLDAVFRAPVNRRMG